MKFHFFILKLSFICLILLLKIQIYAQESKAIGCDQNKYSLASINPQDLQLIKFKNNIQQILQISKFKLSSYKLTLDEADSTQMIISLKGKAREKGHMAKVVNLIKAILKNPATQISDLEFIALLIAKDDYYKEHLYPSIKEASFNVLKRVLKKAKEQHSFLIAPTFVGGQLNSQDENTEKMRQRLIKQEKTIEEVIETEKVFQEGLLALKNLKAVEHRKAFRVAAKIAGELSSFSDSFIKKMNHNQQKLVQNFKKVYLSDNWELFAAKILEFIDARESLEKSFKTYTIREKSDIKKELNDLKYQFLKSKPQDISSLAITPVQRLPRHELLMQALKETLLLQDDSVESMDHILEQIKLTNVTINQLKKVLDTTRP